MLKEIINKKFIEEFKTRIAIRRYPYEVLKQRIMTAEKSGQYELPLTDDQIVNLIAKECKELLTLFTLLRDQIVNLIAKECKEREELLKIYRPEDEQYILAEYTIKELAQYLPQQLTESEVISIIDRLKQTESNSGKLIGLVVKEVGNRFDKSKIAALVRNCLK